LKKVQGKKKRDAEAADAAKKALAIEGSSAEASIEVSEEAEGPGDLLGSKDEDVIF
jgi:V-type H+-transporting ATPase subunit D